MSMWLITWVAVDVVLVLVLVRDPVQLRLQPLFQFFSLSYRSYIFFFFFPSIVPIYLSYLFIVP